MALPIDIRRVLVPAAFLLGTAALLARNGIILSRDLVFLWVIGAMLAFSAGDVRGTAQRLVRDWLPFFVALFAYDLLRGLIGSDPLFTPHVLPQIDVDRALFGTVPTVWLQQHYYEGYRDLHPWDVAAWVVYLTHFFATFLVAGALWLRSRERFLRFRNLILGLTAMAFVTYALFPAVLPWLASDQGALPPIGRSVAAVWQGLGIERAGALWERGSAFSNEVAAIPSLHTAYPVLIMLFFWSSGRLARAIGLGYALAMSLTLVYAGEHYVFDVLLGWVYASAAFFLLPRLHGALARRLEPLRHREPPPRHDHPALG